MDKVLAILMTVLIICILIVICIFVLAQLSPISQCERQKWNGSVTFNGKNTSCLELKALNTSINMNPYG